MNARGDMWVLDTGYWTQEDCRLGIRVGIGVLLSRKDGVCNPWLLISLAHAASQATPHGALREWMKERCPANMQPCAVLSLFVFCDFGRIFHRRDGDPTRTLKRTNKDPRRA